jgi:hypothetical protein
MNGLRLAAVVLLACVGLANAQALEVVNNQPFPIDMPWLVRGIKAPAGAPVQQVGDDAVVMLSLPASGTARPLEQTLAPGSGIGPTIAPTENGVALKFGKAELGRLSWGVVMHAIEKAPPTTQEAAQTRANFDADVPALPLDFKKTGEGPLFETWSAQGSGSGLKLAVSLDVYRGGFVDIHQTLTNESAPRKLVYAAVVCRWDQRHVSMRSVNYDNHIAPLTNATPFRQGEGRHLFIQRGVDWINTTFDGGPSVVMLNDFASSFTVHHEPTAKMPARWVGANTAQLAQEAIVKGESLWNITEIARPNIRQYASRLDSNVLPDPEQPLNWTSRLAFSSDKIADERADQMFIAYTGFNAQSKDGDSVRLTFGVPHVKFGTAYFPYSTLGENFEQWHMPGQSQNTYWPLSADTVTQWKLFADDIRRDLRIAKAMGFESIRLHHLELIAALPKEVQDEYLDFFFGELKHLGLTALLDVKLPYERIAELVKKYRPQVDGVEIDNEVLIFGINDQDVAYWKDVYKAVKEVAPDLPVWLTGHTNTGAFERIRQLGVPFDRVGCHAYQDSLDAISSGRDYALAVANYASEVGKPPVITEWNWRFLTRMTPEARAQVYPPIFENVLKTRCMPVFYQFQFQESLAMASRTLRGIRHYELLNLSRRPRPEAFELMRLIRRYGNPAAPFNVLQMGGPEPVVADLSKPVTTIEIPLTLKHRGPMNITASVESFGGVEATIRRSGKMSFSPGTAAFAVEIKLTDGDTAPSGFYYVFARMETEDGQSSYGWIEGRRTGALKIDKRDLPGAFPSVVYGKDALDFDFNRDISIVYGSEASGWEVESAWLLYQTLEAATGRPVRIFQMNDLPAEAKKRDAALIVVGTLRTNPMVTLPAKADAKSWVTRSDDGNRLIVAGDTDANLNLAAIDLVLRYWKHAKDSGCRRIPLTDKPMPKGADPGALP